MKRQDIQIRDPFVVPLKDQGVYWLFGTTDKNAWEGPGTGFDCYSSRDLQNWDGPFAAFRPPQGFWATQNFWAPEVHSYRGRWYMLASFKADGVRADLRSAATCRGTQVLAADKIEGPYRPLTGGPVTPRDWECLDGTLFVDDQGKPWIVFCHEWLQVTDGTICAMRLSEDLRSAAGEPITLFAASSAAWARPQNFDGRQAYITDGPNFHRTSDGTLLMLWSSFGSEGYAIGVARSLSGGIEGPWAQQERPLFAKDGGHGMLFRRLDGQLVLAIHSPNDTPNERPQFFPIREQGQTLVL